MASCSRELINNRLFIVNECDHDSYDLSAINEHKHTYLNRNHTHIHVCMIVQNGTKHTRDMVEAHAIVPVMVWTVSG